MEPLFEPPVLLFVAHWDDETLSAGGTLAKYGKGWDVVCATTRKAPNYQKVFDYICEDVKARAFTLPIHQQRGDILTYDLVERKLRKVLNVAKYNTIVTHHVRGDIGGHVQHQRLAKIVTQLFSGKSIYRFVAVRRCLKSFELMTPSVHQFFLTHGTHLVSLTQTQLQKKADFMCRYGIFELYRKRCFWSEECYVVD